ncbi:MAG: hypothetical protein M1822_004529 [Bathelium mastoideum]|nr:MAG: hypothetical protein M1822_004529 [Bathelium mastoideum]
MARRQEEDSLRNQVDQQVSFALNDTAGAVRYILDGANEHPNRIDASLGRANANPNAASQPNQNAFSTAQKTTSAFGQPSALGTNAVQPSFGAPSFGHTSASSQRPNPFSQPSRPTSFSQPRPAFGQQPALGQNSSFGQPSALGQNSAFGRPSQLGGQASAFGQPSASGQQTSFGRPVFGQSSFGQPSGLQQTSAFGRPPTSQSTVSPFAKAGQSSQQQSPFAQAGSGFGRGSGQPSSFTARNPFQPNVQVSEQTVPAPETTMDDDQMQDETSAQPPVNGPFGQPGFPSQLTNGLKSGQTSGTSTAAQSKFQDPQNYSTRDGTGRLRTWKGRPVEYVGPEPFYRRADDRSLERIWFPNGPSQDTKQTEAPGEAYDPKLDDLVEEYDYLGQYDAFKDDVMPLEPPLLEWRRYDL